MNSARQAATRILVPPHTPGEIESAQLQIANLTGSTKWTKTEIHAAIIRAGLRHLDEVAEILTAREE